MRPPQPAPDEDPVLAELQRQAMERAPPFVSASEGSAEIVLVADADMFDDGFYVHPQTGQALADNAAFVLNALDNLSGDYALTELRSRAPAARPMTRVDDIETAARQRLYAEQTRLEKELADAEARAGELEARRASGVASVPGPVGGYGGSRRNSTVQCRSLGDWGFVSQNGPTGYDGTPEAWMYTLAWSAGTLQGGSYRTACTSASYWLTQPWI